MKYEVEKEKENKPNEVHTFSSTTLIVFMQNDLAVTLYL